jgi:hypothetical protein
MATNHGRSAIFTDGVPAPLITSFAASESFSRSVDATKAHDMTLVGGACFNGVIFLMAAAVDRALKGSMVGERMNKSFGREVREKKMCWGILKRENPSFSLEFYRSTIWMMISQRIECNGKRLSQKGHRDRPGSQEVWPVDHTLPPEILGFSQNSLINYSIHSYSWFWKFGKKILKKEKS